MTNLTHYDIVGSFLRPKEWFSIKTCVNGCEI